MAKAKKERSLTPKQEKFVAEYAKNGGNAKQAAIKAYPNQTEKSLYPRNHSQGQRMAENQEHHHFE